MAYSPEYAGTCDIYKDGRGWRSNVPFAGQPVSIGPAVVGAGSSIRTAERVGGVIDTVLFGLDGSGNLREINDDDWSGSGRRSDNVGLMSRLEPTVATTTVVIGTYGQWESGPVWLVVNDASADDDNDGLGPQLEAALCTCDYASQSTCGLPCTGLATTTDSDGDGIADDWEVYGANALWNDPYGFPQPLPRWGANPAHKDVFVELDWRSNDDPMLAADLQVSEAAYAALGSATQMANRDGVGGIAVHFDIGSPNGAQCTSTLCGDWGGAAVSDDVTWTSPTAQDFVLSRKGIFHRGITGGGKGTRYGQLFTCTYSNAYGVPHELGHNLGLDHGGLDVAANYNGKPNYHSLMNYAFERHDGFSQGSAPSLVPTALCEADGLQTTTCAEIAHVAAGAHAYKTEKLPGEPYCGVDWNRDGVVSPCTSEHDLVEAAPNFLTQAASSPELGRYYWEAKYTPAFQPATADPDPTATPSLARAFGRLYIAHRNNSSGKIWLTYTTSTFGQGCASPAWGCAVWTRVELPYVADAGKGPALVTTKEGTLMVVYKDAAGVQYRTLLSNHTVQYSGVVANSADIHDEPVVGVGPVGRPRLAFRTGTTFTGQVYMATFDGITFSVPTAQQETVNGVNVPLFVTSVNALAPGMGPTGEEVHMVAGRLDAGPFGGLVNTLHWYRLNDIQTAWVDNQTNIESYMIGTTTRRVGLAFRSYFDSHNAEFGGRYYVVYSPVGGGGSDPARVKITRGDTGAGNRLEWIGESYFDNGDRNTDAGVALLGWERVVRYEPSVRYVGIYGPQVVGPNNSYIDFKPFADGIIPITLRDSTDWEVVERGICASLQPDLCSSSLCKPCVNSGPPTVSW